MPDIADVQRLALALPGVVDERNDGRGGQLAFGVAGKAFAWTWMERVDPKRPRVPNPGVLAIRVASLAEREALLSLDEPAFFTEPHYANYPAILVRLAEVDIDVLADLLTDAWRLRAPKALLAKLS